MSKEELIKMFDEIFPSEKSKVGDWNRFIKTPSPDDIKEYIFTNITPEVLKNVLDNKYNIGRQDPSEQLLGSYKTLEKIKQKAKEQFGIEL